MFSFILCVAEKFKQPKKFPYITNTNYINKYSVPLVYNQTVPQKTSVTVTSRMEAKPDHDYSLAFDNNPDTYWECKRHFFKDTRGDFSMTFSKPITFKSIAYQCKLNSDIGWPMQFQIYGKTDGAANETLLFEGNLLRNPQSAIEIVLNKEVTVNYVSILILKNIGYYATISSIYFLKTDPTREKIENLFTDGTWSEFNDPNVNIVALKNEASKHVLKNDFDFPLRIATDVKAHPEEVKASVYTLRCADTSNQYAIKKTGQHFTPLQATGKIIHYGEKVDVFCENFDNTARASIIFSKTYDQNKEGFQTIELPTGHSVKEPKDKFIGVQFAFVMFMCRGNFGGAVKHYPKVRFVGGQSVPHYMKGESIEKFKQDIRDYISDPEFTNDLEATTGKPNVCEIYAKDVVITDNATIVLNQMEIDEPKGYTLDMVLKKWEELIPLYNEYSGFDINDPLPCHKPVLGTILIKICLQPGKPFAWSDYMYTYFSRVHQSMIVSYVSFVTKGWGFYHEWGHNFDNRDLKISETTNNLYSLMMERHVKYTYNIDRRNCWGKTGNYINGVDYEMGLFEQLAILRQMEIFAGKDTVAKMNRMSREGFFNNYSKDESARFSRWAIGLSNITGCNCAEHFEKHGIAMTQECKNYTKNLKKLPIKTWIITERVYSYKGKGIPKGAKPVVNYVYNTGGNLQLKLTMSNDKDDSFKDILGYEIRDESGNTVGWTYTDKWTSTHKDFYNKNVKYYIYAVGLNMKDSEPTVFEWSTKKEVRVNSAKFSVSPFPEDLQEETRNPGYPITGILDRDPNTCYYTRAYKGSSPTIGVTFDFNKSVSFRGFLHQNAMGTNRYGKTNHFKISISQDNTKWETILGGNNVTIPEATSNVTRKIFFDKEYSARYLRFEQIEDTAKSNRIALCDFALLNIEKAPETGPNDDSSNSDSGNSGPGVAIGCSITVIIIIALIAVGVFIYLKRKKQNEDLMTEKQEILV